jgi:lipoprotein-anchoring transpeptidase ErfK/SrfK
MKRVLLLAAFGAAMCGPALAQVDIPRPPVTLSPDLTGAWMTQLNTSYQPTVSDPTAYRPAYQAAAYSPQAPAAAPFFAMDPMFLPTVVAYDGGQAPGTIIIDTNQKFLFLVLADGQARRYGVGVGRPGFEWAGVHQVTRKAEWPDWRPPAQMRERQPWLPEFMEGGPNNPLGARALYLGSTLYRIHGTSEPWTIGTAVSSGCIRMRNEDVIDLYERVPVGTRVVVI